MNFDPDFLPYDDNRVKIIPTRDNRLGYINASHITVSYFVDFKVNTSNNYVLIF